MKVFCGQISCESSNLGIAKGSEVVIRLGLHHRTMATEPMATHRLRGVETECFFPQSSKDFGTAKAKMVKTASNELRWKLPIQF